MRFEQPDFSEMEPIIEREDKKIFIDPNNPDSVIFKFEEPFYIDKQTPRQLRGSFYLTKIIHELLPENIPQISQIGEDKSGLQTMDRSKVIENGKGTNQKKAAKLSAILSRVGLSEGLDSDMENYIEDEEGDIHYIESFKVWKRSVHDRRNLELLFKESNLRKRINKIPDERIKEECLMHLDRILVLFAEEQKEITENLKEPDEFIEKYEVMIRDFLEPNFLASLHAIETQEEAEESDNRESAVNALREIAIFLKWIEAETNISHEEYGRLYGMQVILQKAIGIINSGLVDHIR